MREKRSGKATTGKPGKAATSKPVPSSAAAKRARPKTPGAGETDWHRLRAMSDAEAERNARADRDNPPADPAWLAGARLVPAPAKEPISLRVDEDVLAWFKAQGRGWQTRMNAVLRAYAEHHRRRA
jgi:uncharacterized protein (DUF4415 family)